MNDVTEFITLIEEVLEIPILEKDLDTSFDNLEDWDSVQLLRLINSIETKTGHQVSISSILTAQNFREIYESIQT